MKKWTWLVVLAVIAVLLALWSMREHFDTYADALKDVGQTAGYSTAGKPTPTCPTGFTLGNGTCTNPTTKVTTNPVCSTGFNLVKAAQYTNGAVCEPVAPAAATAATTPTPTCPAGFTLGSGVCTHTATKATTNPVCSTGFNVVKGAQYTNGAICQAVSGAAPAAPAAAAAAAKPATTTPLCAPGFSLTNGTCLNPTTKGIVNPGCISGYTVVTGSQYTNGAICQLATASTPAAPAAAPPALPKPTTGTASNAENPLFGPKYTSLGESIVKDSADAAAGSRYPALLGPRPTESKFLPSSGSTASDDLSAFFSTARISAKEGAKGTAKLGPDGKPIGGGIADDFTYDPSKVGNAAFSTSSGSYKTEPIPFLTDFSAFFK